MFKCQIQYLLLEFFNIRASAKKFSFSGKIRDLNNLPRQGNKSLIGYRYTTLHTKNSIMKTGRIRQKKDAHRNFSDLRGISRK